MIDLYFDIYILAVCLEHCHLLEVIEFTSYHHPLLWRRVIPPSGPHHQPILYNFPINSIVVVEANNPILSLSVSVRYNSTTTNIHICTYVEIRGIISGLLRSLFVHGTFNRVRTNITLLNIARVFLYHQADIVMWSVRTCKMLCYTHMIAWPTQLKVY
jgi:hypothetical protein